MVSNEEPHEIELQSIKEQRQASVVEKVQIESNRFIEPMSNEANETERKETSDSIDTKSTQKVLNTVPTTQAVPPLQQNRSRRPSKEYSIASIFTIRPRRPSADCRPMTTIDENSELMPLHYSSSSDDEKES